MASICAINNGFFLIVKNNKFEYCAEKQLLSKSALQFWSRCLKNLKITTVLVIFIIVCCKYIIKTPTRRQQLHVLYQDLLTLPRWLWCNTKLLALGTGHKNTDELHRRHKLSLIAIKYKTCAFVRTKVGQLTKMNEMNKMVDAFNFFEKIVVQLEFSQHGKAPKIVDS